MSGLRGGWRRIRGRRHREFRTGLRPTSLGERYVTVPFIITSKIKWLSDSFLLGAKRRGDPVPPPPPFGIWIASPTLAMTAWTGPTQRYQRPSTFSSVTT